jgi:hypothetical protein
MCHHISRNILLLLTKTWNTYNLGCCGSYWLQVHPTGIRTTLCHTCSAVFERNWNKERHREEERNEMKEEEFAVYGQVC